MFAPPKFDAAVSVTAASRSSQCRWQEAVAASRHLVDELADVFDPHAGGVAGLEELLARGADAGGRAGQDDVAGIKRDARRQMRQLLGEIENHVASIGILLDDVVDPELDAELLRILDVAGWHDPGTDRAGVVETLLPDPIPFERRRVRQLGAAAEVACRQLVGYGIAGDIVERLL